MSKPSAELTRRLSSADWRRGQHSARWRAIEAAVEDRYTRTLGRDLRRRDERAGLTALLETLIEGARREGGLTVIRTDYQLDRVLARKLGRTPASSAREAHRRFSMTRKAHLNRLRELGFIASWQPVYRPNGEGRGFQVTLEPAPVAQLDRATPKRLRRPSSGSTSRARRRSSISAEVLPPPTGPTGPTEGTSFPTVKTFSRRARARGSGARDQSSSWRRDVADALERHRTAAGRAEAQAPLLELAARRYLTDRELVVLVVQTFERLFSCPAKLSSSSRRQLVQSLRQMDRVGGFGRPVHGQGFAWLVDQMNLEADYLPGELAEYERAASAEAVVRGFAREPDRPERPRSVGYFVVRLKRTARHWRRGWRARRNRKDDHP